MFARIVARFIIKHARKIYSRDQESLDKARDIVPSAQNRMAFCYDMGFVLEPKISEKRIPNCLAELDSGVPLVGLNISGLLYIGGYTRKNMFGLKCDYRKLIQDLIVQFIQQHNVHIILVPHVLGSVENSESDIVACHKLYHQAANRLQKHLHIVNGTFDQHELKALIGRCDFFFGSRMHACIAAISQCVPTIGLAYSRKFRGVFASIGVEQLVFDLRQFGHNYIMEAVDRVYHRRALFHGQLKAKMPLVRSSVLELFAKIGTESTGKADTHGYESIEPGLDGK
jgi:polysaccharide pyruvyl transferase WcaK-like protein